MPWQQPSCGGGHFKPDGDIQPSEAEVLDPTDGRTAKGRDNYDEDGNWTEEIEWSDESVVELVAPCLEDAVCNLDTFVAMAWAAFQVHSACSDLEAFVRIIQLLRKASEALAGIDITAGEV